MIYMFLSNNPSSGDINSSNLPCYSCVRLSITKLCLLYNLIIVRDVSTNCHRLVFTHSDDVSCTRIRTLLFIFLELFSFDHL